MLPRVGGGGIPPPMVVSELLWRDRRFDDIFEGPDSVELCFDIKISINNSMEICIYLFRK